MPPELRPVQVGSAQEQSGSDQYAREKIGELLVEIGHLKSRVDGQERAVRDLDRSLDHNFRLLKQSFHSLRARVGRALKGEL